MTADVVVNPCPEAVFEVTPVGDYEPPAQTVAQCRPAGPDRLRRRSAPPSLRSRVGSERPPAAEVGDMVSVQERGERGVGFGFGGDGLDRDSVEVFSAEILDSRLSRGLVERSGGLKLKLYNVMYGPPVVAPLLYSACGFIGLLASLMRREHE